MKSIVLTLLISFAAITILVHLDLCARKMNAGQPNRSTYLGGASSFHKTVDTLTNTSKK
jgi:hypothetical protein